MDEHVAVAVDDGEMAGAGCSTVSSSPRRAGCRSAAACRRDGPGHGGVRIDQRAARRRDSRASSRPAGARHEIGVADVVVAVGEGELLAPRRSGAAPAVHGIGRAAAEVEGLEQLQGLRHGDAARRGRAHAADAIVAVGDAQRLALLDAVAGEVGQRDVALRDWAPSRTASTIASAIGPA